MATVKKERKKNTPIVSVLHVMSAVRGERQSCSGKIRKNESHKRRDCVQTVILMGPSKGGAVSTHEKLNCRVQLLWLTNSPKPGASGTKALLGVQRRM